MKVSIDLFRVAAAMWIDADALALACIGMIRLALASGWLLSRYVFQSV